MNLPSENQGGEQTSVPLENHQGVTGNNETTPYVHEEHTAQDPISSNQQLVLHPTQSDSVAQLPHTDTLALAQAHSPRNEIMRVPDAEHSPLYENWKSQTHIGKVCSVSLSEASCMFFEAQAKGTILPSEIISIAGNCWFARTAFNRKKWVFVDPAEVLTFSKNDRYDRIIYFNLRHGHIGGLPTGLPSEGQDTIQKRFIWIEKQVERKKRGAPIAESSSLEADDSQRAVRGRISRH